jgi:hypothetical protein
MARTKRQITSKAKAKAPIGGFKPNNPTVFINRSVVINDPNSMPMYDDYDDGMGGVPRRNNGGRQNQVAITVQTADNDLLATCEKVVLDAVNAHINS